MRNRFFLLFLIFKFSNVYSQERELILNGGFEDVRKPLIGSELYRIKYDSFNRRVSNWVTPNTGTPDIYSLKYNNTKGAYKLPYTNSLNTFFDINICHLDSLEYLDTIYPFKGDNIVALGMDTFNQLPYSRYYKEYIQTKLNTSISPGKKYKLSFYYYFRKYNQSHIDFLEFYFSKNAIQYYATTFLDPYVNQFNINYKAQIITEGLRPDSMIWRKKEVIFKLKDSFEYLTIGNFKDVYFNHLKDEDKKFKCLSYGFYIFLDEISLLEIPSIIGPDSVCYKSNVKLNTTLGMPYYWSLKKSGIDTLSKDSVYEFEANKSQWIYSFGKYGMDSLFIYVTDPIKNEFSNDTINICESKRITLKAEENLSYKYEWNNGSILSNIEIENSGIYKVNITNNFGCKDSFSTYANIIQEPKFLIDSIFYNCFYLNPQFSIKHDDEFDCIWLPSLVQNCEISVDSPQNIRMQLKTKKFNCINTLNIKIIDRCDPIVFIPNAFIPNSTLLANRVFSPKITYSIDYKIRIFNRWGEIVFEGNINESLWDGTYKNVICEQGIYLCVINLISEVDNTEKQYKQLIHLIR